MAIFDFLKTKKENQGRIYTELPVELIVPNPNQPRKSFDDESIKELALSIEQVGLIQPLIVRKNGETYELIAGERRLRAVKSLNMERVPCILDNGGELSEPDTAIMAIIENLQREDLDFFEEAECYRDIIQSLDMTQEQLAERLGKSQSFIANKLRILKLSDAERKMINAYGLTERHTRAFLKLSNEEDRTAVIKTAGEKGLSVKETEALIEKRLNSLYDNKKEGAKPRPIIVRMVHDYRMFMNSVNSACDVLRLGGMDVNVEQADRDNGVDITIHISRQDEPGEETK